MTLATMIDRPASRPLIASIALSCAAPVIASCAPLAAQSASEEEAAEDTTAREEGGRQCFFARNVTGFRNVEGDDTKILVDVRASDTFEFELMNRCPELRFARSIAFDQTGIGRICDGLDVDLIVPDPNLGPQRCRVMMIRKLEPGEEGARAGAKE